MKLALVLVLLLLGFLGGALFDPSPERPIVRRGEYRVLEADFHAHTTLSDGSLTPMGIVRQAERRGLDVVALTEHNSALPGVLARGWGRLRGGPIVLAGEEVTTARFHIIAVNVDTTISPNQSAAGVIHDIHAAGGIAIAAHPVGRYWPALEPVRGELDGAEVMHPIAFSSRTGWRWEEMTRFYEQAEPRLAAIGSSDYHWGSILGLCRTLVFVRAPENEAPTEASVVEALRARRTLVVDRAGKLYGDPALVPLLEREPMPPRPADYGYHGAGTADRVLRTLGWLGLVALVLVGARRRASREARSSGAP